MPRFHSEILWGTHYMCREWDCVCHSCHGVRGFGGQIGRTCLIVEALEELLVVDPGHAADLRHSSLFGRVPIDEVCRDSDSQLPSQFLPLESWRRERNMNETLGRERAPDQGRKKLQRTGYLQSIYCTKLGPD